MDKYIFGFQSVKEAIRSNQSVHKILIRKGLSNFLLKEIMSNAREKNIPVQYVPEEKLKKYTTNNHQGIIALTSPVEYLDAEEVLSSAIEAGKVPFIIILDGVTDVRNFGAIARTAECAGCDGIFIPESGSASITADAIKTSAGALSYIPVCRYKHIKDIFLILKEYDISVVAASEKSDKIIYDYDFCQATALILGSEGTGINKIVLKDSDMILKLPVNGKVESLNVAASAAVFIYEALRQRMKSV